MLSSLHIENMAVIRTLDMDFQNGFSVLTGETGAGKSIIIDSMSFLFGEKIDKDIIRMGESSAMVSGLFSDISEETKSQMEEEGVYPDEEGNILVQRSLSQDGRSQSKINGRSVSVSILKSLMPMLLSIHGQNDTHSLADPKIQRELLDTFSGLTEELSSYRNLYDIYTRIVREMKSLDSDVKERNRRLEMLDYQIAEIDGLKLHDGEEEELVDKKMKLKSREKILKNTQFVYRALKGSEKGSAAFLLDRSATALSQISDVLPSCLEYGEKLRDLLYQIEDIGEEVNAIYEDMAEGTDGDINEIEERLDTISKAKRKYGLTIKDILVYREKIGLERDSLSSYDDKMASLRSEAESAYESAYQAAYTIQQKRKNSAKKLEEEIKNTLIFLDMPKVEFKIEFSVKQDEGKTVLLPTGIDDVEFFISANQGLDPLPIEKIASGGELARIMLAIKGALSFADSVGTVIFDEIDAGVSGKTARKIGMKMHMLGKNMQVFCVTHSAQIASLGDSHFRISKSEVEGKTQTKVVLLDEEGRVTEVSRILGGIEVTEAQRAAALDMLRERETVSQ